MKTYKEFITELQVTNAFLGVRRSFGGAPGTKQRTTVFGNLGAESTPGAPSPSATSPAKKKRPAPSPAPSSTPDRGRTTPPTAGAPTRSTGGGGR